METYLKWANIIILREITLNKDEIIKGVSFIEITILWCLTQREKGSVSLRLLSSSDFLGFSLANPSYPRAISAQCKSLSRHFFSASARSKNQSEISIRAI